MLTGHTVLNTPHNIRFQVAQRRYHPHSVSITAVVLLLLYHGGGGHIPVSRYKAKKKCKATYCYLTPIYIPICLFLSFFLFSSFNCFAMPAPETILPYIHHRRMACVHRSFNFTPLILIPVSSHLIYSKSLHVILDVVVYAIC